ncbi:heme-binding protein [Pseudomonas sp. dw_358]|uniref:GlcG/HbpS family heme-binding protein n=1 Tax=Pseudomonas sp. dw_358 TaxID=2720083 RepID=UPI001BD63F52|nr:heme-binding protein [Pseudomonas sp. dw_358]
MSTLDLQSANRIIEGVLSHGRGIKAAPLAVAVIDIGGHLVSLQRQDGASLLRPQVATGKAWGAIALGKTSRLLAEDSQQRPAFYAALNALGRGAVVPAPGGVLIRDESGVVLGAVGVSGDTSDIDEQCALKGVEAMGFEVG